MPDCPNDVDDIIIVTVLAVNLAKASVVVSRLGWIIAKSSRSRGTETIESLP
jgi:hypothetical protein